MTRPAHTAGPWFGDGEPVNGQIYIYVEDGSPIGFICYGTSEDAECRANARVAAAAPELLEAAQTVLEGLNARIDEAPMGQAPVFAGIAALSDAIAKAGGQS